MRTSPAPFFRHGRDAAQHLTANCFPFSHFALANATSICRAEKIHRDLSTTSPYGCATVKGGAQLHGLCQLGRLEQHGVLL